MEFQEIVKQIQDLAKMAKPGFEIEIQSLLEQLQAFSGTEAQRVYLINISDQLYSVSRSFRPYHVSPGKLKAPGTFVEYSVTEVDSVIDRMDYGLGSEQVPPIKEGAPPRWITKTIPIPFSAQRIAEDVCKEINGNLEGNAFVGVFMSLTRTPSAEALADAQRRFTEYQKFLVFKADQKWTLKRDHRMISDAEKRAAVFVGAEKEWCYSPEMLTTCPACQSRIRPNSIRCPECTAILDVEKCLEYGIPIPKETMKLYEQRQQQGA
jgi:hypothetical protein